MRRRTSALPRVGMAAILVALCVTPVTASAAAPAPTSGAVAASAADVAPVDLDLRPVEETLPGEDAAAHQPAVPAAAAAPAARAELPPHESSAATVPVCPSPLGGTPAGAPGRSSGQGVGGTTSADLASFAAAFNAIRVEHCLEPLPAASIRYDPCLEERLFWMAEDPSTDPLSAWGHLGSRRSDGVPSVGCDGNLAGGSGNSGATAAAKWWASGSHRAALYHPELTGSLAGVCVSFAMTHGGVPAEPSTFTRAAARWGAC